MADKKQEGAEVYWGRIQVAQRFSKKWHDKIKPWNDLWTGRFKPDNVDEDNKISVNYTYSTIKNKVSRLFYQNPKIIVEAQNGKNPEEQQSAKVAQSVVNWQMNWKQYRIREHLKKALYDWKITSMGFVFTGWNTILEKDKDGVVSEILKDQPDIRRIHPKKVHLPPSFTQDEIPYIVLETQEKYLKVKNESKYNKEVRDNLEAKEYVSIEDRMGDDGTLKVKETDDMALQTLYHYYDDEKWVIFAKGNNETPLYEGKNPYAEVFGPDNPLPIVVIFGDLDLESEIPLCEIELIKPQQIELNKIRAQQINHRKRFNRQTLYDMDMIGESELDKLKDPADGTLIGIHREQNRPLAESIYQVPEGKLSYPFDIEPYIKEDINVITGMNQIAITGKSGNKTLGQDEMAEGSTEDRLSEEKASVEDFIEEIYRRLLQLDQAFLQKEIPIKLTGDVEQSWIDATKEDIQGQLTLNVVSGSTIRETDPVVRKQATDVLNLIGEKPEYQTISPLLVAKILETMPSMSDIAEQIKVAADAARQAMEQVPPPMEGEFPGATDPSMIQQGVSDNAAIRTGAETVL
jgi:hypothetical protein